MTEESNIFIAASDGRLDEVQAFLNSGCSVKDQDDLGYSVFHAAASYNHIELMQFLLAQDGTDVLIADVDGDTALHVTETVEMAHLLLSHSTGGLALAEKRNSEGRLAIEVADEEGYKELVEYLKEFTPNYTPANTVMKHAYSEEELLHVLSAADLHQQENGGGDAIVSINMERLQELVVSGQLDGILAHQREIDEKGDEDTTQ
ncbi:ankyrin repeat-containing domain protein [Chytriomyces sp. MP71]|nr:ankyrin repeat-containing domain protein [Chytriomyces sp. MP71]